MYFQTLHFKHIFKTLVEGAPHFLKLAKVATKMGNSYFSPHLDFLSAVVPDFYSNQASQRCLIGGHPG